MNLNLFDDMDGLILRERENSPGIAEYKSPVRPPNNNGGNDTKRFPKSTPLAMAYVPFQEWGEVYSADEAFPIGTLFPELDFPFTKGADGNE